MDWLQILTLIASNFALILTLWLWNRSESRNDHRHLENSVSTIITAIHQEITAINQEMKDFHGRLCAIEERNRK